MAGKYRILCLGNASAIAITASVLSVVLAPAGAFACSGASSTREGAPAVDITCPTDTVVYAPFLTSYTFFNSIPTDGYDGNGADLLDMTGGRIETGGVPVYVDGDSPLDPSTGEVNLLGGNDIVTMSGGAIGSATAALNLNLGEGNNSFTSTGGRIYGSLISGDGNDTLVIGGVTIIDGSVATNGGIDDVTVSGDASIAGDPDGDAVGLGDGNDRFTMTGGMLGGGLSTGAGNDQVELRGGSITTYVNLEGGDDQILVTGTAAVGGDIHGDVGNDTITIEGGTVSGYIAGDDGNDTVVMRGGTVGSATRPTGIDLGAGADTLRMSGGTVFGSVFGMGGGNTYDIQGGTISGSLFAGSQNDSVTISGTANIGVEPGVDGTGTDSVGLEDGDDVFTMTGGTLQGSVSGGAGDDTMNVTGGTIGRFLAGNDGADTIVVAGGSIVGDVTGGAGNDTMTMSLGTVGGVFSGGDGNDTITVSGGAISGGVSGGAGDDSISISGGTISRNEAMVVGPDPDEGVVSGGDGNDAIAVSGGTVSGDVTGGAGDDSVTVSGGTINGDVRGDDGADRVSVSGGTINGGIDAEHVELHGGTITGNISGMGPDTLVIDNVGTIDPLSLSDGVVFSGTGANAQITDTDLAAGGSKTQNFVGFNNVALGNSTLAFGPGSNQQIALLSLTGGSTLFANGNVGMTGTISAVDSTISMVDGAADDVFTLGGLALNNSTIALDLDQQTHRADQLVAGVFTAAGNNVINVNLVGTPNFSGVTEIPIIVSTSGPAGGTFSITGIPGTVGSLFDYEVLPGANGGLLIRATPSNFGVATAPDSAVNGSIVDVAIEALYGINRDALDSDLNLANGMAKVAVTPSFGIFASGQFAHTDHGGYDVYNGVTHGTGPSFDANDFSAAISLDFNAAKHFQFDTEYGLNLGLFAGYASTDVNLNPFLGFTDVGSGTNKSGMFGGYALFRKQTTYALVSASAFLGKSEIRNGILNSTGNYDTTGYAATASVGHIFLLSDRMRFDLRGGILGVSFTGDGYTDSAGNEFGDSRISFGALQFAPGIYGDYRLSNGMTFSPYGRLELQQRFGASNTTVIDTRKIEFDDADFSTALSTGFNLKMTDATTLSGEVRGKWSADSSTIGGKLGLKIAF